MLPDEPQKDIPAVLPYFGFSSSGARSISSRAIFHDMTNPENYLATVVKENGWEGNEGELGYFIVFKPALSGVLSNSSGTAIAVGESYTENYLGSDLVVNISKIGDVYHFDGIIADDGGYIKFTYNPTDKSLTYSQTVLITISYGTPRDNLLHFEFSGNLGKNNKMHITGVKGFSYNTDRDELTNQEGYYLKVMKDYEFYSAENYQGFYTSGFKTLILDSALPIALDSEDELKALAADTSKFEDNSCAMYAYLDLTGSKPVLVYAENNGTPDDIIATPWM